MKLHVSIPTFNRATRLGLQLERLFEVQRSVGPKYLQITVIDNFSTDHTSKICRDFIQRGLFFNYIQNPKNVGLARNLRNSIIYAGNADYLWILSDDDPIIIEHLLHAFQSIQPGYSLIIFNSLSANGVNIHQYFSEETSLYLTQSSLDRFLVFLLTNLPVVSFWISGFWVDLASARSVLLADISKENLMLPALLFILAAMRGTRMIYNFPVVTHVHGQDSWTSTHSKRVMWTDKREVCIKLIGKGLSKQILIDSGFLREISMKSLCSLCLSHPRHALRSLLIHIRCAWVLRT